MGAIGLSLRGFAQVIPMLAGKADRGKEWVRCLIVLDVVGGKPRIVHAEEIELREAYAGEDHSGNT